MHTRCGLSRTLSNQEKEFVLKSSLDFASYCPPESSIIEDLNLFFHDYEYK